MMAYCGLECDTCPILLATLESDPGRKAEMRSEIAQELARIYGTVPKPEIVSDCDGCKAVNGRLFTGCADCQVRNCATVKKVENCAFCPEFACEKLEKHYAYDPASRQRLLKIRSEYLNSQ